MSDPTYGPKYVGPVPKKYLSEFTEQLIEAVVGQVFDIVAWIDEQQAPEFVIDDLWTVVTETETSWRQTTSRVLEGTEVGYYPFLFEEVEWFVHLVLRVELVAATPKHMGLV